MPRVYISNWGEYGAWDEPHLQQQVAKAPVAAFLDASAPQFRNYRSGIYTGPCTISSSNLNHVLTVVGYGKDNGRPFWLLKNSWGTSWGEKGYMRLQRNANSNGFGQCGIALDVYYPVMR